MIATYPGLICRSDCRVRRGLVCFDLSVNQGKYGKPFYPAISAIICNNQYNVDMTRYNGIWYELKTLEILGLAVPISNRSSYHYISPAMYVL